MRERHSPAPAKTAKTASPFAAKKPTEINPDRINEFSLLSAQEEINLGKKIFIAKLALRNIRCVIDLLPIEQQAKFKKIISTGRGKALLETFDGEIINKENLLASLEKEAKDSSVCRLFLDDVDKNDQLTKNQLKQNKSIPEFAQRQLDLFWEGYKAFNLFTNANLRLAAAMAKRIFYGRLPNNLDLHDLVQEGNAGLMTAVMKFDCSQGCKFSTLATWWIRQAINRAIADKEQAIKFPVHISDLIKKITQEQKVLEQERGQPVSFEEAARRLDLDPAKAASLYRLMETIPLDEPIDNNDGQSRTLGDVIPDKRQDIEDQVSKKLLQEAVTEILAALTPKEQRIIKVRFGLDGETKKTLEAISKEFGVTREWIRKIEEKTLKKLRANPEMEKLYDWSD